MIACIFVIVLAEVAVCLPSGIGLFACMPSMQLKKRFA
ncbi:hypothetical protein TRICHSKD4_4134 [Roseibium sp. TrichSKD4]|nr:hypothetical protein TRICHSKD4_4134 [Roseibium sp. TrichSKD4]